MSLFLPLGRLNDINTAWRGNALGWGLVSLTVFLDSEHKTLIQYCPGIPRMAAFSLELQPPSRTNRRPFTSHTVVCETFFLVLGINVF